MHVIPAFLNLSDIIRIGNVRIKMAMNQGKNLLDSFSDSHDGRDIYPGYSIHDAALLTLKLIMVAFILAS